MEILVLATGMWTAIVWTDRRYRARIATDSSPREWRSYRLNKRAMFCASVGVTFFFAWLVTDNPAVSWLHSVSLSAMVMCLAVGAVLSGYAGWIRGR